MSYNTFIEKLRKVKADYRKATGKYPETLEELEKFLDRQLARPTPRAAKAAKSLRALFP